jgi:ribose/xylose/arabinose/galactoside ABC-type transport system permease subunit
MRAASGQAREGLMMDAIERATRWFFAGRNAWVLWPVGIIAVVLAIAATGVLNGLLLGTFLIVVPLAWLVGLLGVGTRDYVHRTRAAGHQLLREAGIPALWASVYTLPVWVIIDWMVALLWWLLVIYIEIGRRARHVRQTPHK